MRLRNVLQRAATLAVALPLAVGLSGTSPAQAQTVEVPGCYGVLVVYCDPAIEIALPVGLEPFTMVIPVCAGTCTDIPVTAYTVAPKSDPKICLKTEDRNGYQTRTCVPLSVGPIGLPSAELCRNGETGVVIKNSDGSTLWNLCFGDLVPNYRLADCYWSDEVGYRVVDENGYEVYNFCFHVDPIVIPNYYVEPCQYPYVGAYVYDEWGNQVGGRCVRVSRIEVPTLTEICYMVSPDLHCASITD